MQKDYPNLIALRILFYPMVYCLATIVLTLLFKKQILDWFELILYIQDEDEPLGSRVGAENRARARAQNGNDPDNLLELTLNGDEEDQENNQEDQVPITLKTYNFKRPQFLKKLTNTYFKKNLGFLPLFSF